MDKENSKVIITVAISGVGTFKQNNPAVPYTPEEAADASEKAFKAGASVIHVHAKRDDGMPTHEIQRIRDTYNAIKDRVPEAIVQLSSAVGPNATADERIAQIIEIKPEMASLNTNTMNFSFLDRKTGNIIYDAIFTNTFTMLQNFGKAMESNNVKPELEVYDIGGLDNFLVISKQGFFSKPYNINFVWGVAGGQRFRPDSFMTMVNALPPDSNFSTCGVGTDEFPACLQSLIAGGNIRVGLEDNTRMPNGELAKGNYELVEWAVNAVQSIGREVANPKEAREIIGLKR